MAGTISALYADVGCSMYPWSNNLMNIWSMSYSACNYHRTVWLNGWVFACKLSGCGFESRYWTMSLFWLYGDFGQVMQLGHYLSSEFCNLSGAIGSKPGQVCFLSTQTSVNWEEKNTMNIIHFLQAILSMNYRQDMHMKFGVHWLFLRNCGLFFTPLYYSLSVLSVF